MRWPSIIELAREIATTEPSDHLHQARLRMAVGNAYYAVYHALAYSKADLLIGRPKRRMPRRSGTGSTWPWAATPHRSASRTHRSTQCRLGEYVLSIPRSTNTSKTRRSPRAII